MCSQQNFITVLLYKHGNTSIIVLNMSKVKEKKKNQFYGFWFWIFFVLFLQMFPAKCLVEIIYIEIEQVLK